MRTTTGHGRVYRRCGCRDTGHRQLGAQCPHLHTDPDHGTWTFAVDIPHPEHRATIRRGGYPTEQAAREALHRLVSSAAGGHIADPNQTLANYLTDWLATKELQIKPTTYARYHDYITNDLIPALGTIPLDELTYDHLAGYVHTQLEAGRGRVTVHRMLATLSSALGDAVRHHRLTHNPARPTVIPRPAPSERRIWTEAQAIRFLHHAHHTDPLFADLVELLIGTGMRKGEALGLQWPDVHLDQHVLYVRRALTALNNNQLILTTPKTRTSRNWVALSDRVTHALAHRARAQGHTQADGPGTGFVFAHTDGRPLRPGYVLDHFHHLCDQAGVPRCTVHDLRHLAATISITHGVPLTIVSKTLWASLEFSV